MGKETGIQWCHHTFNPFRGCTKVSPGCAHCYAETLSRRNPAVLGVWGDQGTRVVASESAWKEPLKWDREAREAGERRRVFCASLADVFEDWQGPMVDSKGNVLHMGVTGTFKPIAGEGPKPITMDDVRERLFRLIDFTPHLDWLLLTKRPENVLPALDRLGNTSALIDCWLTETTLPRNISLGVSAENQEQADRRIPILLSIPAAVRFVSAEPLLGAIDFRNFLKQPWMLDAIVKPGSVPIEMMPVVGLDWVIVGGESGPNRRTMEVGWLRSIVRQCQDAGVPVFVKQDSAARDGQQGGIPDDLWNLKQFPEVVTS